MFNVTHFVMITKSLGMNVVGFFSEKYSRIQG